MESFTLLYIFITALVVQLGLYLLVFAKLAFHKPCNRIEDFEPVTVIICARNEEHNLSVNLPAILEQKYGAYEVIVINDNSTDGTGNVLAEYQNKYERLKVISLEAGESSGGKKNGITRGIHEAEHEIILLTDADCIPCSDQWIRLMASNFDSDTSIVLGVSPYNKSSGLLNLLVRYDTFYTAVQFLSLALLKLPYMGLGRNLAYRKSLFLDNNGFEQHADIPYGDDDLFVNQVANDSNTSIEVRKNAHTVSDPKTNFTEWLKQKVRHQGAGKHYRRGHKAILGFIFLSQLLFYYSFVLLLLTSDINIQLVILLFAGRLLIQLCVFKFIQKILNENIVFWMLSPLLDFLYLANVIAFTISNLFYKPKWK
ncbi:glycosyltransferase [bacterium AH-315-C07]|nr:glycosyltransferase [bacterium AH-315-C07]